MKVTATRHTTEIADLRCLHCLNDKAPAYIAITIGDNERTRPNTLVVCDACAKELQAALDSAT